MSGHDRSQFLQKLNRLQNNDAFTDFGWVISGVARDEHGPGGLGESQEDEVVWVGSRNGPR
jgi:hypothetical protein